MGIIGFELHKVASDYVTADLIIWNRYKARAPGMVELMLDANPQLAYVHRFSPFIPVGVYVRVPIDPELVLGKPPTLPQDSLWTDREGYRLGVGQLPTSQSPVITP
jgi:phage tail protein X